MELLSYLLVFSAMAGTLRLTEEEFEDLFYESDTGTFTGFTREDLASGSDNDLSDNISDLTSSSDDDLESSESDIESSPTESSESSESSEGSDPEWEDELNEPVLHQFNEPEGPQHNILNGTEIDFFYLFFPVALIETLVTETNL